ncbi:hypothetical protein [Pleionea sp. CnH1-48]|uniref:hypothetical protein n=1 Tax=Pleionea sp. CnH1-48 TaxID=2954494 RepID=UPI002098492D|nr:hypothetical protein [Pleionea sp. CnH1-48]MCO7223221.1 hypothetical protein [Pleionea sp. CnH1-48]
MPWRERLKNLNDGDQLIHVSHRLKGSLGQTDIDHYEIINGTGDVVGYVKLEDHTDIKAPHTQSITLTQKNENGEEVHHETWYPKN